LYKLGNMVNLNIFFLECQRLLNILILAACPLCREFIWVDEDYSVSEYLDHTDRLTAAVA